MSGISSVAVGVLFVALGIGAASAARANGNAVGWIEKPAAKAYRIIRDGKVLPETAQELHACDVVELIDADASVRITLAQGFRRLYLDSRVPGKRITVPCSENVAWTARVLAIVRALSSSSSLAAPGSVQANAHALTRGDASLHVPALEGPSNFLIQGDRAISLGWRGGTPPFQVSLWREGSDIPTVQLKKLMQSSLQLPNARFEPGQYVLEIVDRDGRSRRESVLTVVAAADLPARPKVLDDSLIGPLERELLYAYYLEQFGQGEWALESLQHAANIAASSTAAREWLLNRFSVQ